MGNTLLSGLLQTVHGSYYFNYKHTFSIVLLAIVDADYKLLYVDIGCNGRISDGGVFKNCNMYQMLEQKKLDVPEPTTLPGTTTSIIPVCYCC